LSSTSKASSGTTLNSTRGEFSPFRGTLDAAAGRS
jgi:hypothetical protein